MGENFSPDGRAGRYRLNDRGVSAEEGARLRVVLIYTLTSENLHAGPPLRYLIAALLVYG